MNPPPALALVLAAALLAGGCASTPGPGAEGARAIVEMRVDGSLVVDGRVVAGADLPRALRRAGYDTASEVRIELPHNMPPQALPSIAAALRKAGYAKILFLTEKRATATVEQAPR